MNFWICCDKVYFRDYNLNKFLYYRFLEEIFMDDFFDFLDKHIVQNEFLDMKRAYTLEYYFGHEYDLRNLPIPIDGFYLVEKERIVNLENEQIIQYVFLNPNLQQKKLKHKKTNNQYFEFDEFNITFWENLAVLYNNKTKNFYDSLTKEAFIKTFDDIKFKNLIVYLKEYVQKTNFFNYMIKGPNGIDTNLIYNYLT